MANNNNLLFNAALAGFIEGGQSGRSATPSVPATTVAAAVAFATEVDAQIANDGTISGAAGVTLPPTTAAITEAQSAKTALLRGICAGALSGRASLDSVAVDYLTLAQNIVALYAAAIGSLAVG